MTLYTGKGDKGTTKTFGMESGVRISKSNSIPECLGNLDELNSYLGLCKIEAKHMNYFVSLGKKRFFIHDLLHDIQNTLFTVQAQVAGAPKKLSKRDVSGIEKIIHQIDSELSPITTFRIAGGTELSARLDVARTIARRAERRIVKINEDKERKINKYTLAYMNRLSSILYAFARYANHLYGAQEFAPTYK